MNVWQRKNHFEVASQPLPRPQTIVDDFFEENHNCIPGQVGLITPDLNVAHLAPVVWGIRIQPTFALVRVVRGD